MQQARKTPKRADDRGVTMVLVALIMVALLMVVALVVDIGMIRVDRRSNKSLADFAVSAGVQDLGENPWAAVCTAYDYLQGQGAAPTTTPAATDGAGTSIAFATACNGATKPKCSLTAPTTWARLRAVSADGKIVIEIQSPYDAANDPDFAADEAKFVGDEGKPCEQLGVRIRQTRTPAFARVMGNGDQTSLIRSVGRRQPGETREPAALILLERKDCNVLFVGGAGTRVLMRSLGDKPGILQADSDATGACPSPILNGQAINSGLYPGPSIVACSATQTLYQCVPTPGAQPRDSIVGVYAADVTPNPPGNIAPAFSAGTYGDTPYQEAVQFTRGPVDARHRLFVQSLDSTLGSLFSGSATANPPGCGPLVANRCTDVSGSTWLVVSGSAACDPAAVTAAATTDLNVWFNCGSGPGTYTINGLLDLPLAQTVVFNNDGKVDVQGSAGVLRIPNARSVYVRGGSSIGFQVSNSSSLFIHGTSAAPCPGSSPEATTFAIYQGTYDTRGSEVVRTCATFVYLASGGGKVPTTDGTAPCTTCGTYSGNLNVTAGATLDWTAPNQESQPFCRPDLVSGCYIPSSTFRPFEDLALWTESTTANGISAGGTTALSGVFFLPNADAFDLAGGGALPIDLNAQFIIRKLKVTGGATVRLVPDESNAFTIRIPSNVLVR